jgi:hypothetical protein
LTDPSNNFTFSDVVKAMDKIGAITQEEYEQAKEMLNGKE